MSDKFTDVKAGDKFIIYDETGERFVKLCVYKVHDDVVSYYNLDHKSVSFGLSKVLFLRRLNRSPKTAKLENGNTVRKHGGRSAFMSPIPKKDNKDTTAEDTYWDNVRDGLK